MTTSDTLPDRLRKLKLWMQGRWKGISREARRLDETAVQTAYARWAPYYDMVFRAPLYWGRHAAVKRINALEGHVLEAGIGTGMSLPHYGKHLTVTGIDLSEAMLERARIRSAEMINIAGLICMDASDLSFPDNHFDVTVAMYVMPVVPDPAKVLSELERVTRPGGTVLLVNHFSTDHGPRAVVERWLKRYADRLGWNPEFPKSRVLRHTSMVLEDEETLAPFGLFTLMSFRKAEDPQA
ncbi:class I SAM-dependent methyltransferase [Roseibium suaedae]|uniref:Phosphatidylethanolamine/phosphatidyl-N-methylethanolamine N-methyltransferase n=1 Tax=Roseibium suaedae TaxID=735517 RepID=A0A1M7HVF2_9HYPH|nr:class I SAM-dependent methyltransferase [Roseibium suaedae]SHM32502.1 phosphatidylethanolamine/phosphatidyl-N-methylethanolamine N-methyltransferase [Roseibium suaedae]